MLTHCVRRRSRLILRNSVLLGFLAAAACDRPPDASGAASSQPSASHSAPATPALSVEPTASAGPEDDGVTYSRSLVGLFGPKLKQQLMAGMSEGGPTAAVDVCNVEAPKIAANIPVKAGWSIRRTSLKLRNPANAPDPWERKVLDRFAAQHKSGMPTPKLEYSEEVNGEFRYMLAIDTGAMCLSCHGTQLAPDVVAAIDAKYPKDAARGFAAGDIRGAFSVRGKL